MLLSCMEAEASPNHLPVKVIIRNSGGYVRDNALVVTVNTTMLLYTRCEIYYY
jgi:hypothetical protein